MAEVGVVGVSDQQRRLTGLILDTERASEQRQAALQELLRSNGPGVVSASASEAMNTVLLRVDCAYAPVVVRAFGAMSVVPERLWEPFVSLLNRCDLKKPAGLRAVAAFRSRAATEYLMQHVGNTQPGVVRVAAFSGLERLSGQRFGTDADAWAAWYDRLRDADEGEWVRALMYGLATHADGLNEQRRQNVDRTLELLRQLHLRTPNDERTALLVTMLGDSEREVQRLGLRLARGDLANGVVGVGPLGNAARALIDAVDPEIRLNASVLCLQTGVGLDADTLNARLNSEVDTPVLAVLLNLYVSMPTPGGLPAVVAMLDAESGDVRSAARMATIAGLRAGHAVDAAVRDRLMARSLAEASDNEAVPEGDRVVTPLGVAIALRFGIDEVLERLLDIMTRDDASAPGDDAPDEWLNDELVDVVARTPAGWGVVVRAASMRARWHRLLSEFVVRHGIAAELVGRVLEREAFGTTEEHAALAVDLAEGYGINDRLALALLLAEGHPASTQLILASIEVSGLDASGRELFEEASSAAAESLEALRARNAAASNPDTGGAPADQTAPAAAGEATNGDHAPGDAIDLEPDPEADPGAVVERPESTPADGVDASDAPDTPALPASPAPVGDQAGGSDETTDGSDETNGASATSATGDSLRS